MITATIFLHQDDSDGVQVQLMTTPRIGETISITVPGEKERDLKVIGLNHLIKPVVGHIQQIEVVIFTQPAPERG